MEGDAAVPCGPAVLPVGGEVQAIVNTRAAAYHGLVIDSIREPKTRPKIVPVGVAVTLLVAGENRGTEKLSPGPFSERRHINPRVAGETGELIAVVAFR